jgi:ABC-type sugar transport system substrate-binding protein
MFADSVVLAVPGVELVAFVDRTISHSTGTAVAEVPSKPIRNFLRSPPKLDGVITISAVRAVAAVSATAALVRAE